MSSNKLSLKRSSFLNDFGVFPRGEATGNVKGQVQIVHFVHFANIQVLEYWSIQVLDSSLSPITAFPFIHPSLQISSHQCKLCFILSPIPHFSP